ncbi:MAG: T9SS type A sorting domain-containing protein [Ignavibacteriales bacterium]|nr:T9SS type A sorting domain-containing protein [Ignavibacteriales bacterium]
MYHSTDGSTWTTAGNDFLTSFAADADNNGYTTAPGATVNVTNKTLTITISAGSSLYLAWNYSVTSGTTVSNAQALGIDDVSITANSALPVELNSFTAFAGKSGVELNWSTATEVNNYGFDILRQVIPQQVILRQAQDDNNWEKIGFVAGHGNSNSPKDYSFVDANPPAGKVLYKLKQIDFDGAFEYSKVVEVNVETPQEFRLAQNYPNPFNPSTVISYQLPMDGNVTLKVYDMLGKEVTTLVNEFQRAASYNYQFSINNLQLSSGVYYYRLQSGNFVETKKFIVMK